MFKHQNGAFMAETSVGTVVREADYPDFEYIHPDGRTARHPIGYGQPKKYRGGLEVSPPCVYTIDEQGVHVGSPEQQTLFPWR